MNLPNIVPDGSIVIFQSDHGPEYQTMPKKIIGLNGEDLRKFKLRYQTFSCQTLINIVWILKAILVV